MRRKSTKTCCAACSLTCAREEALGRRSAELLATSSSDSTMQQLRDRLIAEGHWFGQLRQRAKDGTALIVEARLDLDVVDGRRLVLESTRDVTQREAMQMRQQLLLGELTHRVKNTLAVVQSIAHQTEVASHSPAEFVERFSGRLRALANAHGLLVKSDWQGADLAALTRVQLQPYTADRKGRLLIDGPSISLPPDLATPFSLVLHELATNAAKYGALAHSSGNVSVTWRTPALNGHQTLQLVWRETGGPEPAQQQPAGLGSRLIEHAIPGANVRREFPATGLVCTIELPLLEDETPAGG